MFVLKNKVTYNGFSIRKKVEMVKRLLLNYGILLCQNFILLEEDCLLLSRINADFHTKYVPSRLPQEIDNDGRPMAVKLSFIGNHCS